MKRLFSLLLMLPLVTEGATLNYYVSPTGTDGNTGLSASQPWTLQKALNKNDYNDGDDVVVNLLGGTYTGADAGGYLQFTVNGGAQNGRMTVQPYRDASVTITARKILYHATPYNASTAKWANGKITWRNIRFNDPSITGRTSQETNEGGQSEFFSGGNRNPETSAPDGNSFAQNAQYIGCVWDNTLQALGGPVWNYLEGNLFSFVGRNPYEHGVYVGWNNSGYNPIITRNVFGAISGHAIKISSGGKDLTITNNIIIDNRLLVPEAGSGQYVSGIYFGFDGTTGNNTIIKNNYIFNRLQTADGSTDKYDRIRGMTIDGTGFNHDNIDLRYNIVFGRSPYFPYIVSSTATIGIDFENNGVIGYAPNTGSFPNGFNIYRMPNTSVNILKAGSIWNRNRYLLFGPGDTSTTYSEYNGSRQSQSTIRFSTAATAMPIDQITSGTGSYNTSYSAYIEYQNGLGFYAWHNLPNNIGTSLSVALPAEVNSVYALSSYLNPTLIKYATNVTGNDAFTLDLTTSTWTVGTPVAAIGQPSITTSLPYLHAWHIRKLPSKVVSATAVRVGNNVTLSWTGTSDTNYNVFKIYRSVNGGSYSLLNTTADHTVNSYADNGLAGGSVYTYKLTQANGFGESLDLLANNQQSGTTTAYMTGGKYHEF